MTDPNQQEAIYVCLLSSDLENLILIPATIKNAEFKRRDLKTINKSVQAEALKLKQEHRETICLLQS